MDAVEFHPFINDTEKVFAGQFTDQAAHRHTVCSYNRGNLLMCTFAPAIERDAALQTVLLTW